MAWQSSSVFNADSGYSKHTNIVFLLLLWVSTFQSVVKSKTMFWKHKKRYICFEIKVPRPFSFSDLSLHRIEINYEEMTILWTYYEHNMNICFSSEFVLGIPSILSLLRPGFWSALSSLFPRDLILFCCIKLKTYLNHWNWNKLVGI